jgi:hypothetical protein
VKFDPAEMRAIGSGSLAGMGVALRGEVRWEGVDSPLWLRPARRVVYPSELEGNAGVFELDDDGITGVGDFRVVRW